MAKVVRENEIEWIELTGRVIKTLIGPETVGSEKFSVVVTEGLHWPPHTHTESAEATYVISGEGLFISGGREIRVKPGSAMYIPPGIEHETKSTTEEKLKFVAIFSPSLDLSSLKRRH